MWLGLRVGGRLALLYIHQMNRVNSRNDLVMMTCTINIVVVIIIIIKYMLMYSRGRVCGPAATTADFARCVLMLSSLYRRAMIAGMYVFVMISIRHVSNRSVVTVYMLLCVCVCVCVL